jgi:thioredoxin-related protein
MNNLFAIGRRPWAFFRGLALLAMFVGAVPFAAASAVWTTDYPAAVLQAKREHKKILLNFTGSDWCIWCQRLDAEVYDTPEFANYAANNLVLVTLDFPHKTQLSANLTKQNNALQLKYQVNEFPTTVLLDENEHTISEILGYIAGGPQTFIAKLQAGVAGTWEDNVKAKYNQHDFNGMITLCNQVLDHNSQNATAFFWRGLANEGKHSDLAALADYERSVQIEPKNADSNNVLAWLMAVSPDHDIRNGRKAVGYATTACELSEWNDPNPIDTLAAAYAETGQFADAIKWETKYLSFKLQKSAADDARERLALYEKNLPYREPAK